MRALIIIDVQNDFVPGGALAVPEGDLVVPIINRLQAAFELVVATQDWHPPNHGSFATNHPGKQVGDVVDLNGLPQILWPVHCVQHTRGAELVAELDRARIARVFQKGIDPGIDSYSGFFDNAHRRSTGLGEYLKERQASEVYIAGLATDYCARFSTYDAVELGFKTHLIVDACRGVNLKPGDVEEAIEEMRKKGVKIVESATLLPETLCRGKFMAMVRQGRWEYADRVNSNGAVVIAAVTPEHKLLLVEQFRIPCGRPVIELPAGIAGDSPETKNEPLEEAARRELLEETGYEARNVRKMLTGPTSAGLTSELVTLVIASGLRRVGQGGGVQSERIIIHEVPLGEAEEWLLKQNQQGKLVDHKVFAGLFFLNQAQGH